MLDLIRKKQKTVIIKVVFWAIIATFIGTIFLVWGKGSDRAKQDASVAVTVNKTKIGFDQYQSTYSNLYRLYQSIYREQFTPALEKQLKLRQQALDTVIDQTLLLEEGDRLGVKVSQQELVDAIAKIPAFQANGTFNKDRYLQILAYQRMTPDQFEATERHQLLIQKVQERLQEGVTVTDENIDQEYRNQNEKVNLAFLRLAPALYETRVKVDEEALKAFFADHREEFRIPETISLRYLEFEPGRYEKDVVLEEGDLEKFYRQNLDRYEIPEQVKAAHILIRVSKDAEEAAKKKKRELAEKILQEARAGKDFAKLARQYSDDPASAGKGGDLGYFTRGTMVPEFEKVAFSLKPGEISDIVETPFGFHIIKAEGYIEAGVKPLADVVDEIKAEVRAEKAQQLAYEKAMDAYNMNRKEGNLEAAAKANDLGIKETGFFSRQEPIDGIGDAPGIAATAFSLPPGEIAHPVNLPQGIFLFAVKDRKESRLPELVEVRGQVEQAFRKVKGEEMARQTAEKILAGLKEGQKLETLARQEGLKVEETGLFTRAYGAFVPRLGTADEVSKAAFTLSIDKPVAQEVFKVEGKYVVAVLKERQEADMKGLDPTKRQELRESLLNRKKEEAVANRLKELREKAGIIISPTIQSSLEGE